MNSLTPNSIASIPGPRVRGRTPLPASELVLSVLIPVYNERNTIDRILDEVHSVPVRKQIICVDDCSRDGTRERLLELKAAQLDSGRTLVDVSPDGVPVRTLKVQVP